MSSADNTVVHFRGVTYAPPGVSAPIIDALDLEVRRGETLVLLGESGFGNTTTLRLINRLLEPTAGEVLVEGKDTRAWDAFGLRRRTGYVIQDAGLFPHFTVERNVGLVPALEGWDESRVRERVRELLALVGLEPERFAGRFPFELSGGQRQRVGVARALAADPPLLLMDEPFGALDPLTRASLQKEFAQLKSDIRKTIVFVTHDIDEAIKMGDKIAVLKRGGILAQYATPAELLSYPADDFVKDFVGADRALKRLALQRVRDIDLWKAPLVRSGEPVAEARAKIADADIDFPLLVDDRGRPVGWLSER